MTDNLPNFAISEENATSEENAIVTDDIPEALRDAPPEPLPAVSEEREPNGAIAWWLGGGGLAIAIIAGIWFSSSRQPVAEVASEASYSRATTTSASEAIDPDGEALSAADRSGENNLLGHLAYEEAPVQELAAIVADGTFKLRQPAAEAFLDMQAAAQRDGVSLVPLSAFRTLSDQEYLFFELKAQRGQVASERAEVSAPPGYSEHHTGYAIDIGDGYVPSVDLSVGFENTAAFQWLQANAAYYSFELSFPPDNPQGIAYEPWHWRYVGDRHSLETFYKQQEPLEEQPVTDELRN